MPRFHFHLKDGHDWPDVEGTELASVNEARVEALRHAGDMLKENSTGGPFEREWQMRVTDHTGLTLLHLDFLLTESPAIKSSL